MAPSSILPATSARDRSPLRARIGEVELARDAPFEQVEMGLQDDPRLHDVEVVDPRRVDARQGLGEEVGLLLVVALEADPVAGADDRLEERRRALRRHHLAAGVAGTGFQADVSPAPLLLPVCHIAVPHIAGLRSHQGRYGSERVVISSPSRSAVHR